MPPSLENVETMLMAPASTASKRIRTTADSTALRVRLRASCKKLRAGSPLRPACRICEALAHRVEQLDVLRSAAEIETRAPRVTGLVIAAHVTFEPAIAGLAAAFAQVRRAADSHQQQHRHALTRQRKMIRAIEETALRQRLRRNDAALRCRRASEIVFQLALPCSHQQHILREAGSLQDVERQIRDGLLQRVQRLRCVDLRSEESALLCRPRCKHQCAFRLRSRFENTRK